MTLITAGLNEVFSVGKIILLLSAAISFQAIAGKTAWVNDFNRSEDFFSAGGNLRFKEVGNINYTDSGTDGRAVVFDGNGSYMEALPMAGNPLNPAANSFSVSFKIKTNRPQKPAIILFYGGGYPAQSGYSVVLTPEGTLRFDIADGSQKIIANGDFPFDDKWHHVELFCDRSGIFKSKNRIWVKIDKQIFRLRDFPGESPLYYSGPLTLGGCGKDYSFTGMLDDLRIEIHQPVDDVFAKVPVAELVGKENLSGGGITLQLNRFGNFTRIGANGKDQCFKNAGGLEFKELTDGKKGVFKRVKLSEQNNETYSYATETDNLKFSVKATPLKEYIKFRITTENLTAAERAIAIRYVIPLKTDNYILHYDANRRITKGQLPLGTFETAVPAGGVGCYGKRSVYPFCAVESSGIPVSLAVPVDMPRVVNFELDEDGIALIFSIGFSDLAKRIGRKIDMEFWLFAHDPAWGFRSTANLYQKFQPEYFKVRARQYGSWLCGYSTAEVNKKLAPPNSEHKVNDYFQYILFFGPPGKKRMAADLALDKDIFYYSAIAHLKIRWHNGPLADKISDMEALELIKTGKYNAFAPANWGFELPGGRPQVYQAALNSLIYDADGKTSGSWTKHFPETGVNMRSPNVSLSPNLFDGDLPTAANCFIDFFLDCCRKTPELSGFYVDWFSTMGAVRNFRKEHIVHTDYPLTFATDSGRVCLLNVFSEIEFVHKLRKLFADQSSPAHGKLLWGNDLKVFSGGTPFLICLNDVIGFEWPVRDEKDHTSFDFFRAMAGKKPVNMTCNITYKFNDEYRRLIPIFYERFAFLGIPAVIQEATKSDELAEFCAPYVDKYVPLATQLQNMGYEIITAAKSDNQDLLVERFGDFSDGTIAITVFNKNKKSSASGAVKLLKQYLPEFINDKLSATDMLTGQKVQLRDDTDGIKFDVVLKPEKAMFIKLEARENIKISQVKTDSTHSI